jgi:hypothetical protein
VVDGSTVGVPKKGVEQLVLIASGLECTWCCKAAKVMSRPEAPRSLFDRFVAPRPSCFRCVESRGTTCDSGWIRIRKHKRIVGCEGDSQPRPLRSSSYYNRG